MNLLDAAINETNNRVLRTENTDEGRARLFAENGGEIVNPGHDTVTKRFEKKGAVVESSNVVDQINNTFDEVQKVQLYRGEVATPHYGLTYKGQDLPQTFKEGYVPHSREDVINLIRAAEQAFNSEVKVSAVWNNGHFVSVRPSDAFRRSIFGSKDNVYPRLLIQAGYDGRAFRGQLGWFRDCCNNLTWLKNCGSISVAIRHSASLDMNLKEAVAKFEVCASGWESTVNYIRAAEEKRISLKSFLVDLFGNPNDAEGRAKTNLEKKIEKIFNRVVNEREKTGRPSINNRTWEVSGWEAYNAIQGYAQHDQRRQGQPNQLERVIKAAATPEVAKAEELIFETVSA